MHVRNSELLTLGLAALGVMGVSACAGPATPLGSLWAVTPSQVRALGQPSSFFAGLDRAVRSLASAPKGAPAGASIRFYPRHQVLHDSRPVTVIIEDPAGIPEGYKLAIRYNGFDVTRSFLQQARLRAGDGGKQLRIAVPTVKLFPSAVHDIEVMYIGGPGSSTYARYAPPLCHLFETNTAIRTTEDFAPTPELMAQIDLISRNTGINPAFTTALIAQESGFNPRQVSWARAIGLTQITGPAAEEISERYEHWPRYPGLGELPFPVVKFMVGAGTVNARNEWRLDPARSIQGGLSFAETLAERWSRPDALALIKASGDDPETAFTALVLASYNSGYTRVSGALARDGAGWLAAPELKEARRYANRIISYCDHFSAGEVEL